MIALQVYSNRKTALCATPEDEQSSHCKRLSKMVLNFMDLWPYVPTTIDNSSSLQPILKTGSLSDYQHPSERKSWRQFVKWNRERISLFT